MTRSPLLLLLDPELFHLRDDVLAGRRGLDGLVDERDLAVRIDVVRPALRELALWRRVRRDHLIREGDLLVGVGEHRKVRMLFGGERLVVLERIDADHEVRDVESANDGPALTERVAFGGSTGGE